MRRVLALLLITIAAASAVIASGGRQQAAGQGGAAGERIAFESDRLGDFDIWLMDADGGRQDRLTQDPAHDVDPSWAPPPPSGVQRLAFASDRDGDFEIYSVDANGSDLRKLTDNQLADTSPAWSPDGRSIAFTRVGDAGAEILIMAADGSREVRLTGGAGAKSAPTWSPDSQRLAFASVRDGTSHVYLIERNGNGLRRLTDDAAAETQPSWFRFRIGGGADPSVRDLIAFSRVEPGVGSEVASVSASGTSVTNLSRSADQDSSPAWASDGLRLAFESDRDGNYEIYAMGGDGRGQTRLTIDPGNDLNPDFSGIPPPPISLPGPPAGGGGVGCSHPGTSNNDLLRGTGRRDEMCGYEGKDRIRARGGDDLVLGGDDADKLRGGGGRDSIVGGDGRDRIRGGGGNDVLDAQDRHGGDYLFGGRGRDRAQIRSRRSSQVDRAARVTPTEQRSNATGTTSWWRRVMARVPGGIWTLIIAPVLSAAVVALILQWLSGPSVSIERATRRGDAELRTFLSQEGQPMKPRWRTIRECEGVVFEVQVKASGLVGRSAPVLTWTLIDDANDEETWLPPGTLAEFATQRWTGGSTTESVWVPYPNEDARWRVHFELEAGDARDEERAQGLMASGELPPDFTPGCRA